VFSFLIASYDLIGKLVSVMLCVLCFMSVDSNVGMDARLLAVLTISSLYC